MASPRTLRDLALRRLQVLFPRDFQRIMNDVNARNAARAVARSRCSVRGCAFPSETEGFCRGHFEDAHAQFSLTPSLTGTVANCPPAAAAV
jgi:hypothetical protein